MYLTFFVLMQPISYNSARGGISQITERGDTTASFLLVQPARFRTPGLSPDSHQLSTYSPELELDSPFFYLIHLDSHLIHLNSQQIHLNSNLIHLSFTWITLTLNSCTWFYILGLWTPACTVASQVLEISSQWRFMWYEVSLKVLLSFNICWKMQIFCPDVEPWTCHKLITTFDIWHVGENIKGTICDDRLKKYKDRILWEFSI